MRELTEAQKAEANEKGANAFALVTTALASVASLYLGVTGFFDGHLLLERKSRGLHLEFDGLSAQIASLGLIIFAVNLAFSVYTMAAQKSFQGPVRSLVNLGWVASAALVILALLIRG